ncbi:uncharacterized protein BJ212DRAFT_1479937 [Suillus subaureus]|uniref:Uncharacterized protein n=1 Tax=Suillus subaureus TaxID=48587 RepID=A0A9P7JEQ6_9AGAM|nr:uncharacterized protein BJ212DRAFT_1479937 [Suillus subaureus]KAG1818109.1 hypothetical protein BJ212DRAFT_1479937 [Suillus subaureus]
MLRLISAIKTALQCWRLGDKHQRGTSTASSDTRPSNLPAQSSSPLSSTHDQAALPQVEAAMVLPAPASGGGLYGHPLPDLDDNWGSGPYDDGYLMDLDDMSSADGDDCPFFSLDDEDIVHNHDVLFLHDLEEELILDDDIGDHLSDEGADLDAADDLVNNPAFQAANALDDGEDDAQQGDADEDEDLFDEPPAFDEHSAIWNAYVRAYVAAAFKGATHKVCRIILDGVTRALTST